MAERGVQPRVVVVRLPAAGDAPEHVGRADHVAGVGEASATARMYGPTPKISWISSRPGPEPASGVQTCRSNSPSSTATWSVRWCRHGRHRVPHGRSLGSLTAVRAGRLRLRPAASGIAQTPDRAPRRGPAAGRPGRVPPPEHRHVRDLPELLGARRPAGRQRHQGDPGPPPHCSGGTGGAVEVLLLEPLDDEHRAWEAWCARPASSSRARCWSPPTARPFVVVGRRTEAGDTFTVELVGAVDPLAAARSAHGEMPLPPYITDAARRSRALPDGVRRRAGVGRRTDGRPAPHPGAARRARPPRASSGATVELVVGLDTFQPVADGRPARHRIHSERYRVPADDAGGVPRRRPRGGRRHHQRPRAGVRRRARRAGGPHRPVHPPALRVAGGRPAADQLPPAPHDAADDDRRLRRPSVARPVRRCARARATASCRFGDAMLLDRHA